MATQKIKITNVEIIGQESEWPEVRVKSMMEDLEHRLEKFNLAIEQREDFIAPILLADFMGFLGGLHFANVYVAWTFVERKPVN